MVDPECIRGVFASRLACFGWLNFLRTARYSVYTYTQGISGSNIHFVHRSLPQIFDYRVRSFIMAEDGLARQNLVVGVSTTLTALSGMTIRFIPSCNID
jgi:hypothetical protein